MITPTNDAPPLLIPLVHTTIAPDNRFVRKLTAEDVNKVQQEAVRKSRLGEVHADEFNPHGQAYLHAEAA